MKELLRRIRDNNILLEVVEGKLQVFTVDTEIDPALLADIKTRKEDLLRFLSDNRQEDSFAENIPVAPPQETYPLSSAQRRLWLLSQSASASLAYHMAKSFRLQGRLDETAFEHAFNQLIARHESLRTVFREIEPGQVRQLILPARQSGFRLAYYNLLNVPQQEQEVQKHVQKLLRQPFNLESGPMIRASLVRTGGDEWVFTYVMHHIISDGWSMEVMIKELLALYNAHTLKPLRIQYKDYAVWQQEQLNAAHHKEYWAKQLQGELPVLALPTDHPRGAVRTYNGGMVHKQLDSEVLEKLKALLQQEGATLFMGMVAAVNGLLYRYTGQTDIITGNPTAGREHVDLEGQVGLYLNAMALRARFNAADSFRELLSQIKKTSLEAYEHRAYPFDQVVSALNIAREAGRNALFDVFIDLHEGEQAGKTRQIGELTVTQLETGEHAVSKFDLTFMFTQSGEELTLSLEYNSDLYERETAVRMMEHFEGLLRAAVKEPNETIRNLQFIPGSEIDKILSFNTEDHIDYVPVVELIEKQAADAPAVIFNNTTLTYGELNEKANQLAHCIKHDLVGIMLDRSEKLIIAILAVLKAGAAYVPIDPDYPAARKSYIMQDSGMQMLLTQTDYLFELGDYSGEVFAMDAQLDMLDTPVTSPGITGQLAYVIYTSGSTGTPKGCCISHNSLSAYIQWANRCYFNNEKASFGLFTSLSFDLTVTSIFCSLTSGGTLTVYDQRQELPEILAQNFSGSIDSIKLTPSHINILKQLDISSSSVSCAVVGGEEVTEDHVNTLKKINPAIKIYNEYGPTEATVGCIVALLEQDEPITIGKPITGAAIYILDDGGALCPIGVPGEIHIAGAGLAVKYLNKPELTNEKFIETRQGRLYKTGDLGKWLPDGNIKFLGRKDDQVKIRGYRIELGEIDHALSNCAGVNAAITIVRSNELVAYIASDVPVDDVREQLSKSLPAYMVPAHIVTLDRLPLTANGKIDKRSLPQPQDDGPAYVAPRNELEQKLATILQEVLDKPRVGITDNFFALGGDSIKAITFVVNVHKQLGYKISVNKLYENPTIEKILSHNPTGGDVHEYHAAGLREIEQVSELIVNEDEEKRKLPRQYEDIYPVVPIEQGMIFSSLLNPNEPVYYDQFSFIIKIEDLELFKEGMAQLVRRHSILRTKYFMSSFSVPVKVVLPELELPLTYQDISGLSKEEKTARIRQYVENDLKIRLSFDDEVLWRINMFRLEGNEHYITYSFHHAMLDGWSVSVFKTEIANFQRKDLKPLRHSYKDYCAISLGRKHDPATETFWKDRLQGYTRNKLPFNFKGTRIKEEYGMKKVQRTINKSVLDKLNQLAGSHQLSFKAICLSAHIYLMHLVCSEHDVTTGMVTHERPEIEDGENILGCFLTTVPIRISFDKLTDILSLLKQVNDFLLNAKAHEVHLGDIARFIGDKTSFGNPVFDTILNYTDFHRFEDVTEGALINILEAGDNVSDLEVSHEMTNTLFDVEVGKTLDKFTARIKYVPGFFNEEDVRYALDLYVRILESFAGNVHANLASLNLLTEQEMKEVLIDFNATAAPYATEMTLDRLFEAQVLKTPEAIALKQDGMSMSYKELNERANQLAGHLIAKGVKTGDNIGLHATRSFNMIIGMYGILKAGGAYVPIDPEYPQDRKEYIIRNSGVQTVVSYTTELLDDISIIPMDELDAYSTENLNVGNSSRQLAYTIYTSGSTGRPKGVMIAHHSAVNLVQWVNKEYSIGENDRLLFITSMCFDLSVYDIFGMLAAGGTVVIARNEEVQQITMLKKLLKEERITFWDSVPTTMNYLVTELDAAKDDFMQDDLRVVFLSGDWIPVQLPDRIRKYFPAAAVISLGGATEGTVWSNYYPIGHVQPDWSSIPYGKPITNNSFYILNDLLQPVPKGVAGELYIGGVGVAKGYANDPEKTAASFKPDPFTQQWGGMMYKTGDLGRMMPDGNMEFLGRKDNQVKIRGFRVELGEIESVLQRHDNIKGAIVDVFKDSNGMNQLCAYLIPEQHIDVPEIKEYLKGRLPAYMVPVHYMILQSFPLNSNGKINRKALPRPAEDGKTSLSAYVPPATETQKQVAQIWRSILNTDRLSIRDDLFEQGANSLSVGAFVNRVHREMGLAINLRDVFIHPTIEAISGEIEKIKWAGGELFEMETSDTENFSI